MSVFKATDKRKQVGSDSGTFKSTKNKSYDSAIVYNWQISNKKAADALNTIYSKRDKGEYMSSEDMETYSKALDDYIDSSTKLRNISKSLGEALEFDDNTWQASINSMKSTFESDKQHWSKYENEDAYKDDYYNYTFGQKYAGIDTVEKWQEAYDEHVAYVKDFRDAKLSNTGALADNNIELPEDIVREGEYLKNLGDRLAIINYDSAAAEAEIAYLQEAVDALGKLVITPQMASSRIQLPENYGEMVAAVQEKYGMTYAQAKDRLAEATVTHNQMVSAQEKLNKSEYYDTFKHNSDFAEYSKYDQSLVGERTVNWGATILQGSLDLLEGMATTGMSSPSGLEYNYDGLEYGFVNGDPQATQWYIEEYREDNSAIGDLIRGETEGYNLYTFLEENEKEMYNYIYKSQGEEAAHEYLEFLASDLKTRKANERAEWFKKQPTIGKIAYSVPVGIDQFVSGAEGIFKDEYDPSVTSMVGQEIRKDLADEGKILWYNIADGSWNTMKVMGSSGAQMLYDIGTTTSNMLPSILVSAAVEAALPTVGEGAAIFAGLTATQKAARIAKIAGAAGSLTLGASAVGNAKQEMLGMGYSVEQANAYGLMVGASEAGLSYLLSGIPGLRGSDGVFSALGKKVISKVDNALARAAITLGGNMGDEAFEEGLQTVLEGWFKEIATGVDFEDPSIDEILYSSLLGALTAAGFGGGKLSIDTGVGIINTSKAGKSFIKQNGQSGVGALTAQGLGLNQNTAAYKQASKVQAKLDKGKSTSNYSVGKLLSGMSESQTSTAIQTRLSAHIENKTEVRKLSNTITDILYGREVSDKAIKTLAANKYALNALNDVLGSKLNKGATVSDVRAAIKSYQEAGKSESGANASTKAKQGSASKISGRGDVQFAAEKNADGGYDVVGTKGSEKAVFGSFKSQKQAQAAVYAMTLGMGAEGFGGLINLSENLPNGVDLGEAALAFNAIYNQGKNGKALSAAKNANLLSPEQRQYAYNLGIMDKALDGVRTKKAAAEPSEKNDGKVLQKDGVGDTIKENEYAERSTKYDETLVEEKTGAETGQGVDNTTRGDRENETGDTQMRAAVGQRPSVSKRIRETTKGRQTLRRRLKRRLNTADKKYRVGDCIIPQEGSIAHGEQTVLDQYGAESYIIKNEAWEEPHIAFTRNGIVYMQEGIPESERGCVADHEANHVMKQIGYPPYMDFLARVGGMLDLSNAHSDELIKRVADHTKVDIISPKNFLTLYDELNAMLFGARHNVNNSTRNAFYDYDAYIQELTEIHEQYKREVKERAERHDTIREFLKDSVAINSLVFGNKESPVFVDATQSNAIFRLDLELDTVPFYKGTVYSEIEVDSSEDLDDFAEMYADGHIASFDIFLDGKKHKSNQAADGYRIELEISSNSGHDISLLEGFEDSDAVIFDRNSDFIIMEVQRTDKTLKIKLEDVSNGSWADNSNSQNNGNSDPDVQQAKSDQASSSEWSTERIKDGKVEKAKPISEIIEQIRHDFGINITKGHVRGKGVLGQYSRRDHGIRTKIANDLPTVSHELGHALDQRYGLTDKSKLTKEMRSELVNALGDLKDSYKQNLWVSEGFAEYIRRFLQNRDDAARAYPEFTKHFLNSLSKNDRILMDTFADEINAYYALDADTATSSIRLREEGVPDARTALEKAREMGDGVYQAWVDANHGIRLFDEAAGGDTYKLASNAAYSDAIAGQIITGDLTDANGQYVAPGLKSALEGVNIGDKKIYREFGEYLVLKHGPERLSEGMRIFADERKNTTSFMDKRAAELEAAHPEFKEAADKLYEFQRQFLKTWAVDTGLLPSEVAEAWAKRWSFYVPLNRAVGKAGTIGAKRGYANQNSTVRKAIGSGLDIVHPVDNIINNIVKMVNAGVRNNVMLEITVQAESLGADAMFLEKVPTPMKKKTADLTGVKAKLHDAFGAAGIEELLAEVDEIIESTIDDVLVQYGQGKAHGDVVTVLRNGKQEFWKINDALLLESLTSMSQKKMGGIMEAYAVVSRFMTSNITGNNIIWSIFSNFPRDMMTFFTYSKQKNPLKAFPAMGEAYLNRVTGGKADTKNLPYIKEYHALGGGQTSAYTADVDLAKRARKKIKNSTKLQSAAYYANPLNLLSFVSETVESGPRIATYIMMREQGMSPQEAFYESQDITVNFKRGGRLSREVNRVVPFFNASVQGLDKFRRWITCADVPPATRAKAIVGRVTVYVAVSAALGALFYALNNWDEEDEENYRLLSNYTKNTYWNIPLGDGKYFAIPKPREIAVLSTFVETTCEYVGGNDYAYDEFGEYVADNFLPPFLSDLVTDGVDGALGSLGMIGVVSDLRANKDFLGRPIESTSLQGYETQDRYTRRTSMIAYWLGQAAAELGLDWSPVQIDYFFGQTLGGYWKVQKALFPVGSENVDWTLGVQNTYIKDNQYSNDIVNWLYDEADASSEAKKSNPDDMEIAIDAKMDSNLSTFYSRYYALTKGQKEDSASRRAKRVVLDMIIEYRKATDNGDRSAAEKAVYDTVVACKDTSLLPAVMQSKIKDSQGKEYALTDIQYVEYQTIYEGEYWSFVEERLGSARTDEVRATILKNAKKIAKEKADQYALRVAKGNK